MFPTTNFSAPAEKFPSTTIPAFVRLLSCAIDATVILLDTVDHSIAVILDSPGTKPSRRAIIYL
jgi:hypothetical protein